MLGRKKSHLSGLGKFVLKIVDGKSRIRGDERTLVRDARLNRSNRLGVRPVANERAIVRPTLRYRMNSFDNGHFDGLN